MMMMTMCNDIMCT